MRIRVECYSGYKADERPLRVYVGEKALKVKELLDRWYGVDHDYFKLLADDGNTYILKHHRVDDFWELTYYATPRDPCWVKDKGVDRHHHSNDEGRGPHN